jgi:spermidine synthase
MTGTKSKITISRPSVLLLFFFSGGSALVYEVVWGRMLTLVFGGTAFAISTVLAAFMGGLALGSYLFGRLIDRRGHPLFVYGLLEAGIGVWALLLPRLLGLLDSAYASLYSGLNPSFYTLSLIRFLLTFVVILVPTTMMGGTLPVLMRLLTSTGALVGRTSAFLYFANTAGAVAGSFLAGFILIPVFGIAGTIHLAVLVNFGVTFLAVYMSRKVAFQPSAAEAGIEAPAARKQTVLKEPRAVALVLLVYALSGLTALGYEVAWTRVLVSIIGTTTYAFTTMLTTFLLGLALGSLLFSRVADRVSSPRPLALLQLFIGLLALATIPMLGSLPAMFLRLQGPFGSGWWGQVGMRFVLCMLAMLPPAILMGGTFPVVARLYAGSAKGVGAKIGVMYAFNTVGAIFGSFLAGFVAIPLLGQEKTILAGVALNILAALILVVFLSGPLRSRIAIAAAGVGALALAAAVPRLGFWDVKVMNSGVYLYGSEYSNISKLKEMTSAERLLYFREDRDATVAVWQEGAVKYMRINGKTEASTGADMLTQRMVGTLPLLFHPQPREGLLIGLASGVTAGSMLRHPLERLDCVEIVRGMDQAAECFKRENYDCLNDPRFNLIEGDGRNYLMLTDKKYDAIVSQGSNPWVAGCVNLFTVEFFQLAREHLKPGGIMGQWVQIYSMTAQDLKLVLNTFHKVFPHVTIWQASEGDLVLLGSVDDQPSSYQFIVNTMGRDGVAQDLDSVGLGSLRGLFSCFLFGTEGLDQYLTGFDELVTDDDPSLEFTMPRTIGLTTHDIRIKELASYRERPVEYLTGPMPDGVQESLEATFEARGMVFSALKAAAAGQGPETFSLLRQALKVNPEDALGLEYLSRILLDNASELVGQKDFEAAAAIYDEVRHLGHISRSVIATSNLGMCYLQEGRLEDAVSAWRSVLSQSPEANYNIAEYYYNAGYADSAAAAYERAIDLDPNDTDSMNNLAWLLAEQGVDLDKALTLASRAAQDSPSSHNSDTLGWVYYKRGEFGEAARVLQKCIGTWGENPECLYHLGMAYAKQERRGPARDALRKAADLAGEGELRSMALEALNAI